MGEELFDKLKREKEEYLRKHDVGFYVTDSQTKFIRSKRFRVNYNWELKYDEITCIAFGRIIRFDDDSSFIIIISDSKKPIYFNMTYDSEEMKEFEIFMTKLKKEIGLNPIWKEDKIIIAYPEKLRGMELYKSWKESIQTFTHEFGSFFGMKHHVSGIIKDEIRVKLKTKE